MQGAARPLVRPQALFSLDTVVDFECIIIHIHHKKPAKKPLPPAELTY